MGYLGSDARRWYLDEGYLVFNQTCGTSVMKNNYFWMVGSGAIPHVWLSARAMMFTVDPSMWRVTSEETEAAQLQRSLLAARTAHTEAKVWGCFDGRQSM